VSGGSCIGLPGIATIACVDRSCAALAGAAGAAGLRGRTGADGESSGARSTESPPVSLGISVLNRNCRSIGDIVASCCDVTSPFASASFTSTAGTVSACTAIEARIFPVLFGSRSCLIVLPTHRITSHAMRMRNTAAPAYIMKFGSFGGCCTITRGP
jgi:hypothetical protein